MFRSLTHLVVIVTLGFSGIFTGDTALQAAGGGASNCACDDCGEPCREYDLTPCTVWVKALVLETRMQSQIVKDIEQREETYTVFVKKPVTREYKKEHCYLEDDVKTTTVVDQKCHIVRVPVERTYTVKVPRKEMREIPVCAPGCTECSAKGGACETRLCEVIVETKEERTESCTEPRLAIETCKSDITYCVKVPKKHSEICATETTWELVPVEKTRLVDVCVSRVIKTPVDVTVCKMVPQERNCCSKCRVHHDK